MDQAMSETLPPSDLLSFDLSGLPVTDADEEASSPAKALKLVLTTVTRMLLGLRSVFESLPNKRGRQWPPAKGWSRICR